MLTYVLAYVIALILFLIADAIWLTTMGGSLYRATLGDVLAPEVQIGPAIAFYLLFPIGIVVFAVLPGLRSGAPSEAALYGALLGLITYATYDLTNFATLRNWTLKITVIDLTYGAVVVGLIAFLTTLILHWLGRTAA